MSKREQLKRGGLELTAEQIVNDVLNKNNDDLYMDLIDYILGSELENELLEHLMNWSDDELEDFIREWS